MTDKPTNNGENITILAEVGNTVSCKKSTTFIACVLNCFYCVAAAAKNMPIEF